MNSAAAAKAATHFSQALWAQQTGDTEGAVRNLKRAIAAEPRHAPAHNNLAVLRVSQGRYDDARALFASLIDLTPELLDDYPSVVRALHSANPELAAVLNTPGATLGQAQQACADDELLHALLRTGPVRDAALEWVLTRLRRHALLNGIPAKMLPFHVALAQQCFLNEYVFAQDREADAVEALRSRIEGDRAAGQPIDPALLVVLAMYRPLGSLENAQALLQQRWPAPVTALLEQQIRQPAREAALREGIAPLTPISPGVSEAVRAQYEENPYPRWVKAAAPPAERLDIDLYLRRLFPSGGFSALNLDRPAEILVAGCGTGRHPIELSQILSDARILAIDLSLASLAYAQRKTEERPPGSGDISFAQADILQLGMTERMFDVIDASGVLHHLADPEHGWRILLSCLRPGGVMHVALYSEQARRHVAAARAFVASQGFEPTPEGIRQARQALLTAPIGDVISAYDFFTTSECRDLLFHVQEQQLTIPRIRAFLQAEGLRFIGFNMAPTQLQPIRDHFATRGWPLSDLHRWEAYEQDHPDTFSAMYQFWVQKRDAA